MRIIIGKIKNILYFIILIHKNNSPIKFIVKGADIFTIENKNHINDKEGKILIKPFNRIILRV